MLFLIIFQKKFTQHNGTNCAHGGEGGNKKAALCFFNPTERYGMHSLIIPCFESSQKFTMIKKGSGGLDI